MHLSAAAPGTTVTPTPLSSSSPRTDAMRFSLQPRKLERACVNSHVSRLSALTSYPKLEKTKNHPFEGWFTM